MTTKKSKMPRGITRDRALRYTYYADKLTSSVLSTEEEKRKFFHAIYTLRELSDKFCEIHGIDADSLRSKLVFKDEENHQ